MNRNPFFFCRKKIHVNQNFKHSFAFLCYFWIIFCRLKHKLRFEDNESQSELDEEVHLPKKARVIHANIIGTY